MKPIMGVLFSASHLFLCAGALAECNPTSLERGAYGLLSSLETSGNPNAIQQIYLTKFSKDFQKMIDFGSFQTGLAKIQSELGVGHANARSFEGRSNPWLKTEPLTIGGQNGFRVESVGSSRVGKVVSRAFMVCEDGEWKAAGIWYVPAANLSQIPR